MITTMYLKECGRMLNLKEPATACGIAPLKQDGKPLLPQETKQNF